jgi:beta-phosphoglucomutase
VNARDGSPDPRLEAVIFDAEGVVIDTEAAWDRAQAELLARRQKTYDRARVKHLLTGRAGSEGIRVLIDTYGLEGDARELEHERREIMRGYLGRSVSFIDGFEGFFRDASARYRTALATSMDLDLFEVVDAELRLTELFGGHVFTLDHVGFRAKPNPDLFLRAAEALGVSPAACAVIEDAPLGVEAAKRAGMTAIGLATTYEPAHLAHADYVARGYADLDVDRLERLAAGSAPA